MIEMLGLILAILLGIIAYQQFRLEKEQFKVDLFEKRFQIYKATESFIQDTALTTKVTGERLRQFSEETQTTDFLFDDDVVNYVEELRRKGVDLHFLRLKHELQTTSPEERTELIKKELAIINEFFDTLPSMKSRFAPYLKLSRWKHGLIW